MRPQFTLRGLLGLVTLAAVIMFGVRSWWTTRLEYQALRYFALLDEWKYEAAYQAACDVVAHHPDSILAKCIYVQACKLSGRPSEMSAGVRVQCMTLDDTENLPMGFPDAERWHELSKRARRGENQP